MAAGPAAPGYAYPPPPFVYGPPPWEMERRKQIDRTKTGILLLLIGTLLIWIPVILFIGGILLLIGAILVILGRKAFGPAHSRNVVVSIVLFIVGIIGAIILGAMFALASFSAAASGTSNPDQLAAIFVSAFNNLLIGAIIVAAISGVASVLFTYALQAQTGRILLWAGYGANLGVNIAIFAVVSQAMNDVVDAALSGGTFDATPFLALEAQMTALGLLAVIPSAFFAGADYLAWSRINRGEIPAPPVPPPAPPGAMPPAGGTPPGEMPPPIQPR